MIRPLLPLVILALLPGCDCDETVVAESASPDGIHILTVFKRDCGATTQENVQLALRKANRGLFSNKRLVFAIVETGQQVTAAWSGNGFIDVAFPEDARVFKQEPHAGKITIRYRSGALRSATPWSGSRMGVPSMTR